MTADAGAAPGRRLPSRAAYVATAGATVAGWTTAAWLWSRGSRPLAFAAFAAGLSLGPCLIAYLTAPRSLRPLQGRLVLITLAVGGLVPLLLEAGPLTLERSAPLLLLAGAAGAALAKALG